MAYRLCAVDHLDRDHTRPRQQRRFDERNLAFHPSAFGVSVPVSRCRYAVSVPCRHSQIGPSVSVRNPLHFGSSRFFSFQAACGLRAVLCGRGRDDRRISPKLRPGSNRDTLGCPSRRCRGSSCSWVISDHPRQAAKKCRSALSSGLMPNCRSKWTPAMQ